VSCIDVTIMDRSAHSALPSPYSKIFPAFRAGAAVTHSSLCERGGIHVANEDRTVGFDQVGAQFMQEVFAPIRDLGVNRSGSVSMAGALVAGQGRFQVAIKALRLDRWQRLIREGGKSSQPQIDAQTRDRAIENRLHGGFVSLIPNSLRAGHTDIQMPASAAVFAEITRPQFEVAQSIAIPQRQPTSVDLSPSIANRSDLKGNPPERPPCTTTLAPGQPNFLMLSAPPRVFFRDLLHRLDRKMQGTVTARGPFEEGPEIKYRQETPLALEHFERQFVAVIEDQIDLARQAAKPLSVLVLHPQAQDPNSATSRAGHPYSIPKFCPVIPWQTSRNANRGRHARLPVSRSLAGLKAGLSRGEIG
jgi:hypothetical protein